MKLRCLLIDDEPPALKVLQAHMSHVHGLEIAGLCKNAVEAIDVLHEKPIDLIFLDIKMPMLLGTDFLKSLSNPPKVIFVTAYRDYAVEGYDLDAVDYLIKPVSFERLLKAISKVRRLMGHGVQTHVEEYKANPDAFVYLKVDKTMQKFFVNEIVYIESWKDYVKLFLINDKHFVVKQSISSMEDMLSAHKFLRIHRSFIVSLDKISGYNGLTVQVNKNQLPIGRLYKPTVIDRMHSPGIS